jgi:hypothetical protein
VHISDLQEFVGARTAPREWFLSSAQTDEVCVLHVKRKNWESVMEYVSGLLDRPLVATARLVVMLRAPATL